MVGDGGFAMLMAELATAVQQDLPVKVLILNNGRLAEVAFEQCKAGFGVFGCELSPIDFVAYARPAVPTGSVARNRRKNSTGDHVGFPFPQPCDRRGNRRSRRAASQTR